MHKLLGLNILCLLILVDGNLPGCFVDKRDEGSVFDGVFFETFAFLHSTCHCQDVTLLDWLTLTLSLHLSTQSDLKFVDILS